MTALTSAPYIQLPASETKLPIPELHDNKHHNKENNLSLLIIFSEISENNCKAKR
jgi:hypothetical protein